MDMSGAELSLQRRTHSRLLCKDCDNAVCKLSYMPCKFHRDICDVKCTECSKSCCMPRRECIDKLFDEVSVIACLIKLNIKDLKDSIQKEQRTKGGFTGEQKAMVNAIRDGYKKAKDVAELLSGLDVGKATAEQLSVITFNDFCVNRVMELMPETEAEFEKYISEQRALRYSSGRKKEKVRV